MIMAWLVSFVNNLMISGNEVDQTFSILCQELKCEIRSVDELIDKIKNAPISPKPEVDHLWSTWDWSSFIQNHMAQDLKNHSWYNAFQVKKEDGAVKLRCKKFPQDLEWKPATGIRLIKADIVFEPVPVGEFRVEDIKLDDIFKSVNKYLLTLNPSEKIKAASAWNRLRERLESLPRRRPNLPKLKLLDLPKQVRELQVDSEGLPDLNLDVPDLVGDLYPAELVESSFSSTILVDMDVVVYTKSKSCPWLGRVSEILPGGRFNLHWYSRRSRSKTFYAMFNKDGSKFVSEEECDAVMLWEFSTEKTENTFVLSDYWLQKIQEEYLAHDQCYSS